MFMAIEEVVYYSDNPLIQKIIIIAIGELWFSG